MGAAPAARLTGAAAAVTSATPTRTAPAIEVHDVRRRFGDVVALDGVTFAIRSGAITGFLGPNGAGKTTLIRLLLGLDRPDSGRALVLGSPYAELRRPTTQVGAFVDGAGFHPNRTARAHLQILAAQADLPQNRIGTVLTQTGLHEHADRRVGGYSLGMRQRLGLASALLGDPRLLILDEPTNGLDPAGTRWLRDQLRAFSRAGGSVLVSSHQMAEMELIADDVVVIAGGRLRATGTVADLTAARTVIVHTPTPDRLLEALGPHVRVAERDGHQLVLRGVQQTHVGLAAAAAGVVITELRSQHTDLESIFLTMTGGTQ